MAEHYSDVSMIEITIVTPQGQIQRVWRVSATSKGGTRFTVEVPDKDLETGAVAKALSEKARILDAITGH